MKEILIVELINGDLNDKKEPAMWWSQHPKRKHCVMRYHVREKGDLLKNQKRASWVKEDVIKMRGSLGLVDHSKDFYFYSKCSEKPLASFRQRLDIMQFMFLKNKDIKYKAVCNKCMWFQQMGRLQRKWDLSLIHEDR